MEPSPPSPNPNQKPFLTVSIVTYQPDIKAIKITLKSLAQALNKLTNKTTKIYLIQNSQDPETPKIASSIFRSNELEVLSGHGNIGFGRAHNICLGKTGLYHLILNPDIELEENALINALGFLADNTKCGLVSPHAIWPNGERQYLCKRYPALFDLILRGFAPKFIRNLFSARLSKYEMRSETSAICHWDPPIVSGCFMLYRGELFERLGGFDPRFFLYFEDFDLSLRTSRLAQIAYVGNVRVIHAGGHAARKGLHHVKLFAKSAFQFYRLHGYRLF